MEILKKEMAPIPGEAWNEITGQIQGVLKNHLTARKFVDIEGPFGFEYSAVSTGRLAAQKEKKEWC